MSLLVDQTRSNWEKAVWRMPTLADAELGTGYAGLYTDTPDNHAIIDKGDGRGAVRSSGGGVFGCSAPHSAHTSTGSARAAPRIPWVSVSGAQE